MPDILIRATDPAAAAEALRAFDLELEGPDRANPTRWHGSCRVTVSVVACAPGERPSLAIGSADLDRALARLPGDTIHRRAGDAALVDVGGVHLSVVADPGPAARPGLDRSLLPHAEAILSDARVELADAFARLGVQDARLAGPQLVLGHFARVFTLIVDDADDMAVAELNAILARHAHPPMRIEARSATSLEAETLARVDRLAWDLAF